MQCHSCVCILWHEEPQKWLNPGVEVSFGDSYYIFWHSILTILFKMQNWESKKKKNDPYFRKFWVGQKRANKRLFFFFFLGRIKQPEWWESSHTSNIWWDKRAPYSFCVLYIPLDVWWKQGRSQPHSHWVDIVLQKFTPCLHPSHSTQVKFCCDRFWHKCTSLPASLS